MVGTSSTTFTDEERNRFIVELALWLLIYILSLYLQSINYSKVYYYYY